MNKDQVKGRVKEAEGMVKEITGKLVVNTELEEKGKLEKTVGKPVETVPQIFVDQKHIGGCTDFEAWAKENLGLFA